MKDGTHAADAPDAARRAADRVRLAAPWRHPSRLSAAVWLYLGAGSEIVWSGGTPAARAPGRSEDFPYLAEDAADGMKPAAPGEDERFAAALLDGLLPAPREIVAGLHSRDFAPPSDMPALRLPYDVRIPHLAGVMVACHVMLGCAPVTLEPAAARRAQNRRRFARGLHLAVSAVQARGLAEPVRRSAAVLLDGVAARAKAAGPAFADPGLSEE